MATSFSLWSHFRGPYLRNKHLYSRTFSTAMLDISHAKPPKFRLDHLNLTADEPRASSYSLAVIEGIFHPTPSVRMLRLRALRGTEAVQKYEVFSEIEASRQNFGSEEHKKLNVDLSQKFSYNAGQWVDFAIPSVPLVGGYSIVSFPFENDDKVSKNIAGIFESEINLPKLPSFDLAVKVGRHPPAAWVHSEAKVHDIVAVRAGGSFCLSSINVHDSNTGLPRYDHIVLIAGGVGINPLYSMLLALSWDQIRNSQLDLGSSDNMSRKNSTNFSKITLLYSCRNKSEVLFLEQLQALYSKVLGDNLRIHITLTREEFCPKTSEDYKFVDAHSSFSEKSLWDPSTFHEGRITSTLLEKTIFDDGLPSNVQSSEGVNSKTSKTAVILCGPPTMTDSLVEVCKEIGVQDDDIHFEKWW